MKVDAIFDAFYKATSEIHKLDAIQKKQEQINRVTAKRCGNCDLWMKSTCIPEKKHGQFKSMNSRACNAFTYCHSSLSLQDEFTAELAEIVNE
jgi:hypothetical protein